MYRVLICDDQPDIVNALKIYLKPEGYELLTAQNGKEALELAAQVDLILMDIMMPVMDGIVATDKIREFSNVPIILLTAKSETEDVVLGLNVGADDYITKPFSMEELLERIKAISRRIIPTAKSEHLFQLSTYTFDTVHHVLIRNGEEKRLTRKEMDLLYLFCEYKNRVVERTFALQKIWNKANYFSARNMDVYINKIRKLLQDDPNVELQNVHGVGYKLVVRE